MENDSTPPVLKTPKNATSSVKRPLSESSEPQGKRAKSTPEASAQYSDAVRKKLASTSRTGQACDRCKERKMKCDTDPISCQPCRQKGLRCFTTDRVSGQSRERGQLDRADYQINTLQERLAAYEKIYGPLSQDQLQSRTATASPAGSPGEVSSVYVGWPVPGHSAPLHAGPIDGSKVDIMDGIIDVADFDEESMRIYPQDERNRFNLSSISISNTISGYQSLHDPRLPPKEEAIQSTEAFMTIMSQYVPVLHRPTFEKVVHNLYDNPSSVSIPERVQVMMVLTIIAHQAAVRNHSLRMDTAHHWFHYSLSQYRQLVHDKSIASMQALTLMILHLRTSPKPGSSFLFSNRCLLRAIALKYHRDPDKIELPPDQQNPLAKELRKRIFHSILTVCVTTGCKVGLPAPWHFQHMDCPLPAAVKDVELSANGFSAFRSGKCDFWICLHLSKLLPLLTELHNNITCVRKSSADYVKIVDALDAKIKAWRQDWEVTIAKEDKHKNLEVATLLVDTWAAEYQLYLHHPRCCTAPELADKNLEICHKAARKLLQAFHTLSNLYKGVDFTWHSTIAYAAGFGITLYVYQQRKGPISRDHFDAMMNELKGWLSLMAYADLVLRTSNHLQHSFEPRVRRLEEEYRARMVTPISSGRSAPYPMAFQQSLQSVNGSMDDTPQRAIKSEPSQESHDYHMNTGMNGPALHDIHSDSASTTFSHEQVPPTSYRPTPFQYIPHSVASFPTYTTTSSTYQTIPTSLAPLLNNPTSVYMNYQNGHQPVDSMIFSPQHYYDDSTASGWPYISMQGIPNTHH